MGSSVIKVAPLRPFVTSRDDRPLVNLRFSGTCHRFLCDDHFPETTRLKEISVSFNSIRHLNGAHGAIVEELEHWPHMPGPQREDLVVYALRVTREAMKLMPKRHNVLRLHFVASLDYFGITARPTVVVVRREEVGMVAAAEEEVEKLMERKKVLSGGECAICMEGYFGDCEVVSMPCSHDFHGDCIYKWLMKSHYCPLCRFQMPIATHRSY